MTKPGTDEARARAQIVLNSHFFYGNGEQLDRAVSAMLGYHEQASAQAIPEQGWQDDDCRARGDMYEDQVEQLVFELSWELEEAELNRSDLVTVNREKLRTIAKRVLARTPKASAQGVGEVERLREALKPFADCCDQIAEDESDEEWAKFRLLIGDYRRARAALASTPEGRVSDEIGQRFYIDCEFDGHSGPLLSLAIVREDGESIHIETTAIASDPWVIANVVPVMSDNNATTHPLVQPHQVGPAIRGFIGDNGAPIIIADSPVDIGRFCAALSTGADGGWASTDFPLMTFEVHNVDCYPTDLPGAVQHNAWWDAMALRAALNPTPGDAK